MLARCGNPPADVLRTPYVGHTDAAGQRPEAGAVARGQHPAGGAAATSAPPTLEQLLARVAREDHEAFEAVYRRVSAPIYGLVRSVLRNHAKAEEVTQEVLVEIWRTAPRFDQQRGPAQTWMMTLAHRRAVDRVRSEQAAADREARAASRSTVTAYDEVTEQVEARLDRERVRHCMETLTVLQRESVTLAYYRGHSYREVSELLDLPLGTVKTRLRDGLIRLRDCLGVTR
jgi:RNA polymerase sigma-70 factor, ECF subfamily